MYNWNDSLLKGKTGVDYVKQLLAGHSETVPPGVEDVQNDPTFQTLDIDLLWHRQPPNSPKEITTVEVKWDAYMSGNFALETRSVVERHSLGCFLASRADLWYYCFPNLHKLYVFPLNSTRAWFQETQTQWKLTQTSTNKGAGVTWHTECALVPIAAVMAAKALTGIEEYAM